MVLKKGKKTTKNNAQKGWLNEKKLNLFGFKSTPTPQPCDYKVWRSDY